MSPCLNQIMLIEDCEADNYLHNKIIRALGVAKDVVVMRCGDDALAYLRACRENGRSPPELIFLDINTPGMEGWDFLESFEQLGDEAKTRTTIIMLSGSLNPDDRERGESIPLIKEYRTKPLTREAMLEIMNTHFCSVERRGA